MPISQENNIKKSTAVELISTAACIFFAVT